MQILLFTQILKRLDEFGLINSAGINKSWKFKLMLSIKDKDKYFYLKDGNVAIVKEINSGVIISYILEKCYFNSFFSEPDESKKYGIYVINRSIVKSKELQLSYGDGYRRGICLPLDVASFVLFSLVH